jgi:NAD-dependent deacetylase
MRERLKQIEQVRGLLQAPSRIAVLTGAGVSAESGIPTFRTNGGFWQQYRFEDLATPAAFARDPKFVWTWYGDRRRAIAQARPNAGHFALAQMEEQMEKAKTSFTLVTQNVDGLHDLAGSKNVIKLHGDIWTVRCMKCSRERVERAELNDLPPLCECGGMLRPGVVWFGEVLPEAALDKATAAVRAADVLIVAGTSAQVYPAAGLIPLARAAIEINPEETAFSSEVAFSIRGPSAEILPQLL